MIKFLETQFGARNVKKIYYFSNGARLQDTNKYKFLNILHYKKEFSIDPEWYCLPLHMERELEDVKRSAYCTSLQDKTIVTKQKLYTSPSDFFKIPFYFCSREKNNNHHKYLASRFSKAKIIKALSPFIVSSQSTWNIQSVSFCRSMPKV